MAEPPIVLTDVLDERDMEMLGGHLFAVLIKDGFGHTVGGLNGRSRWRGGVLYLDYFNPTEAMCRSGLAARMLAMAEEEGRRRTCRSAVISTIGGSGKTPAFFEEQGWRVLTEIPCGPPNPPGASEYFMTKDL
jgi:hypothetical protein